MWVWALDLRELDYFVTWEKRITCSRGLGFTGGEELAHSLGTKREKYAAGSDDGRDSQIKTY